MESPPPRHLVPEGGTYPAAVPYEHRHIWAAIKHVKLEVCRACLYFQAVEGFANDGVAKNKHGQVGVCYFGRSQARERGTVGKPNCY